MKITTVSFYIIIVCFIFLYSPSFAAQKDKASSQKKEQVITVTGHLASGARARYTQGDVNLGPLGNRQIIDTPLSAVVVPHDLVVNQQARNIADLVRYLPSTQLEIRGDPSTSRPQSRGFEGGIISNTRIDGLSAIATTPYPAEWIDDLQVLNGLSGALYGTQNPAGTFNYVLKRPTDRERNRLLAGVDSVGSLMENADMSGRHKWFGYRLNLLHGKGTAYSQSSSLRRDMVSADLDFHIDDDTLLELDGSHYSYVERGMAPGFAFGPGVTQLPSAPDLSNAYLGQKYAGFNMETDSFLGKIHHRINDDWRFTLGGLYQDVKRNMFENANTLINNSGGYRQTISSSPAANRFHVGSNMAYFNGHIQTDFIRHDIEVGTNGYILDAFSPRNTQSFSAPGTYNMYSPVAIAGHQPYSSGRYHSAHIFNQSMLLGDTLTFNKHWSVMGMLAWSWMNTSAQRRVMSGLGKSSHYGGSSLFTPQASVMYKPDENQMFYFTYGRSLQPGMIAPAGAKNVNAMTQPLPSTEYEVGYKLRLDQLQFTVDGFRMERGYGFTDPTTHNFGVYGNQRNYGAEAQIAGYILPNFSIFAGMTWLDAELLNTGSALTSHKEVVGVAPLQADILLDYKLPYSLGKIASQFAFNANVHYMGGRAANVQNTLHASGFTTLDLGVRYGFHAAGLPWMARFTVSNVANTRYWASIYPNAINGSIGATSSAFAGLPRMYHFSLEVDF